jgi:hypothetical protein
MADNFEKDFEGLLNHPLPSLNDEQFLQQVSQRIGWARRLRTMRATILVLGLVLGVGAAFFVTLSFLQMAGSEVVDDNPTAALAFWFPYGVVAVTLAVFLRGLIEQTFRDFAK